MLTAWRNAQHKWKRRFIWGASVGIGGLFYLKVVIPSFKASVPCVFHLVTGCYCPGCGMTRATLALMDFHVYQAFRYNMLVFLLLPLYLTYEYLRRKKQAKYSKVVMTMMVALAILFGVLRNFPAFAWLAPTAVS